MLSQHVRTTGARLAKPAAQKSASASILWNRACSIVGHANGLCLQRRSLFVSGIKTCNSFPVLKPSRELAKPRPNSRHGGGQGQLIGDRRLLHTSLPRQHGISRPAPGTGIKAHFQDSKGNLLKTVEGNEGDSLLDIAHEYDIDLEGACEGSVACSTCHVILTPEYYDSLPEPEDDENDMLDMAFGLTDTSRLGCQVKLTKGLDGITATLPSATRNMFVDGAKPTKH